MRRYKKKDNQRRNQIIMGLFLAFLMVFSILGYVIGYGGNSFNTVEFNGHKFELDAENNVLVTKIDGKEYYFYNYPDTVVPLPENAVQDLLAANQPGPKLTFNPLASDDLPIIDSVRAELDDFFLEKNIFLSHGVYGSSYRNFPLIDCVNATEGSPVIKFINSSSASITYNNYCLEISATGYDLGSMRDSLLYSLLGIV